MATPQTTRDQAIAMQALGALKYKIVPDEGGKVGGPTKMTATDEALDSLKGKTVEVRGDGTVVVL